MCSVLAIIFDFMAFTAQIIRTLIGYRDGTANNLAGLRALTTTVPNLSSRHTL